MWIQLYNHGDCMDFSAWEGSAGQWDSIEKFLYRDGGVDLEPTAFTYEYICGEDGVSLSDHLDELIAYLQ